MDGVTGGTEIRFAKVGNDYINTARIEKFLLFDDDEETFLSVSSGHEFTFTRDLGHSDTDMMTHVARKITEKSHDLIYLEASSNYDESIYSDDQKSNLLYRKWVENKEEHHENVYTAPPDDLLIKGIFKLFNKKRNKP